MELRRITEQNQCSLTEYFTALGCQRTVELIEHLQQEVEGPPQWVTTSHFWFYLGSVDHWDPWKARVFIEAHESGYLIRYRSASVMDWGESFTEIRASTLVEAGWAVKAALERALLNPPGRFDHERCLHLKMQTGLKSRPHQ